MAASHASRAGTLVRFTIVLLAVAGAGHVAGMLFDGSTSSREISAAFARPLESAEAHPPAPLAASVPSFVPADVDWSRPDIERIEAPRECDAARGLTIACVFMD